MGREEFVLLDDFVEVGESVRGPQVVRVRRVRVRVVALVVSDVEALGRDGGDGVKVPFFARGAAGRAFGTVENAAFVPGVADAGEVEEVAAVQLQHNLAGCVRELFDADYAAV